MTTQGSKRAAEDLILKKVVVFVMNYFVTQSYNHKGSPRRNTYIFEAETCVPCVTSNIYQTVNTFKDEAQTALYKDKVRIALGSGYKNQLSLFFHRACCYYTLFKNQLMHFTLKIHIKPLNPELNSIC
jgi:hypothetical protein